MKKILFKIVICFISIICLSSCNKWYDNYDMLETILSNGLWQIETLEYNCNMNSPDSPYLGPDKDECYYRVYKPNGLACLYSNCDRTDMRYEDTIFIINKNDYYLTKEKDTVYYICTYGEWWVKDSILYVNNYFYLAYVHWSDLRWMYASFNNDFDFLSSFTITKYSKNEIISENKYETVVYECDIFEDTCYPTDREYTLQQYMKIVNRKL